MKNLFTNIRRGLALKTLLAAGTLAAQAQNVGIGTTAPNTSAALDIVSTSKGALLARAASVTAMTTPATGLIVYQTDGTPGYYYNTSTSGAPNWQQFATAAGAAVTASNGLTKTRNDIALGGTLTGANTIAQASNNFNLTGGKVGLGTTTPNNLLDLGSTYGANPSDPTTKKLAVYNNGNGTDFYGLGV